MNTASKLQKYALGASLLAAPLMAQAAPADDVQAVIVTAGTVFGAAAAVGISILGYRIVKGLISRFTS